jgi:hypothetical protein
VVGRLLSALAFRAVMLAGIVGNLTISIYLSVVLPLFFHTPAIALFQWDDSNIVGPGAFSGGLASAALGFFFDFIVSWVWALLFVALYNTVAPVRSSSAVSGLLFGVVVMLVMGYVVVPLGHAVRPADTLPSVLDRLIAHTLFFGLPLALTVRAVMTSPRAAIRSSERSG